MEGAGDGGTWVALRHLRVKVLEIVGRLDGVGCHCLLQCMKVKSESEVAQSCLTLSDPMDYLPGSSVHGILQARVLEWGAIAFSLLLRKSDILYL